MSEEADMVQINIIADVYILAAHGGLSIEAALEQDTRLPRSTYYHVKKERPELIRVAMEKAEELLARERTERSQWLESLSTEVRDEMRAELLSQMRANVKALTDVRDTAPSQYTRLQAAIALTALLDKFDKPDVKEPKLPPPPRRNTISAINSLLSAGAKNGEVSGNGPTPTAELDPS